MEPMKVGEKVDKSLEGLRYKERFRKLAKGVI